MLLQTGETYIVADDVLGKIQFQAPDESSGTDAILVAAEIAAVSEGNFAADYNATKLSFKTGSSGAASEKMSLSSGGNLTISGGDLTFSTAGQGVHLGVTTPTAANLLDDYEEGTWTATLYGTTTPGSITQTGYYTKVGRSVDAYVYVANKNTTGFAGAISLGGLPFASLSRTVGSVLFYAMAANEHGASVYTGSSATTLHAVATRDAAAWASVQHSAGTARYMVASISYIAA